MEHYIKISIFVALLLTSLSSCKKDEVVSLVGTKWYCAEVDNEITFVSNKEVHFSNENFFYITIPLDSNTGTYIYTFPDLFVYLRWQSVERLHRGKFFDDILMFEGQTYVKQK